MSEFKSVSWQRIFNRFVAICGEHGSKIKLAVVLLMFAAILQGIAYLLVIKLLQAIVHADKPGALFWLSLIGLLTLLCLSFRWWVQGLDYGGTIVNVTYDARTKLGERLKQMPLQQLQQQRTGATTAMVISTVDEAFIYFLTIADLLCCAILLPLSVAIGLFFFDWRLALVVLAIFPLLLPLYWWQRPKSAKGQVYLRKELQGLNADILEYLQGMAVLRSACNVGVRAEVLRQRIKKIEDIQNFGLKKSSEADIIIFSVIELALLAVVLLGLYWVSNASLELTVLAGLIISVVRFSELFSMAIGISKVLDIIELSLAHIERLNAIVALPQLQPAALPADYSIGFERLSFNYTGAENVCLEQVNLKLPQHSLTALVGPSGSGKTTLTRLLMRHFDPQVGRVTIGGIDIRRIPIEELNKLISVVFQDVYLFNASILDNIRMAKPEASDAEIEAVAIAANCHEFITRLPLGYQTQVGDIGASLSGGEKQRISIARALLKDAPIVILDEPTAALDTESEYAVQQALNVLVQDRTVIVIAHRLSTIAGADRIVVLENGVIVQQGTQQQLLQQPGRYQSMWQVQLQSKGWHLKA